MLARNLKPNLALHRTPLRSAGELYRWTKPGSPVGRVSDSITRLTECCIGNRYVGQESLNMLILIGEELAQ